MIKEDRYVLMHEYYDYGSYMGKSEICQSDNIDNIKFYLNKKAEGFRYYNDIYTIVTDNPDELVFTCTEDRYKYRFWINKKTNIVLEDTDKYDDKIYYKVEGWE